MTTNVIKLQAIALCTAFLILGFVLGAAHERITAPRRQAESAPALPANDLVYRPELRAEAAPLRFTF